MPIASRIFRFSLLKIWFFCSRDSNNCQQLSHRDDYVNREVIREAQREREIFHEYRHYVNQGSLRDMEAEANTAQRRMRTG